MSNVIRLPKPFGCRQPPPPPTSLIEPFNDERSVRLSLHLSADSMLRGVLAFGDRRHVPPSRRLYTSNFNSTPASTAARDADIAAWQRRWYIARLQDAQNLPASTLLSALEPPMCRERASALRALPWLIGRLVHARIMAAYRAEYPANETCCDGRVFFTDGSSKQLSELAQRDPNSVYGGLNYCLAGQRVDIIDLRRGEMWEIKPASMASAALLQLWGYLDNYEVARVEAHYFGEPPLPVFRPGDRGRLSARVTRPFTLALRGGYSIVITPFTVSELPGLILYEAKLREPDPAPDCKLAVRQAMAITNADIEYVIRQARRTAKYITQAEDAERQRLLVYAGIIVLLAVGVYLAGVALGAGAAAGTAAEGATLAATGLTESELGAITAEIVRLSGAGAANDVAGQVVAQVLPWAVAATVTLQVGGREFNVLPEAAILCLDGGCQVGVNAAPQMR